MARASYRAGTGDSTKMSSIPTPASVANSHSDFLNIHQSLTATVLGILVSFSEGWLVFQVVLYHQPAVPYQPNTPPKRLKPNSSMTQITLFLPLFLHSALLDPCHLYMMTLSRWSTPFVIKQLVAEHLSKPCIAKTYEDYIPVGQQGKKLMLVLNSFLFSDFACVYVQVL